MRRQGKKRQTLRERKKEAPAMMNGYNGFGGMGAGASLFMVLGWVAVLLIVVWAVRMLARR